MKIDRWKKCRLSDWLLRRLALAFFLATTTISSWAATSSVSIQWDASQSPNVTNYTVLYGTASGSHPSLVDVGNVLVATIPNLTIGMTYYFVVTARDTTGMDSDPSNEVPFTAGNTPPTVSSIANQAINQNTSTAAIAITVGDMETAAGSLALTQGSSNPALVPVSNIVFGGSGAGRTVTVTPAAGQSGTATITVSVSDGQLATSTSFVVTVNAVNTAPTISTIANQTINQGTSTAAIGFTVGDTQTAAGSLTLSPGSSNPTLVALANIVFVGSGASRTVTVTPAAGQAGTATITVSVSDGLLTTSTTFVLTVNAVNTAPTISTIANQSIGQGTSTAAIGFTVGDTQTAAGSLIVSPGSSNPTLVPLSNIVFVGSGASRTVTVTPTAGQTGTATITVSVSDGLLTTSTTFVLTVNAVNTAPTISPIANQTINEDSGTGAIGFTVGDAQTAAGSLSLSKGSSNPTLVPVNNIVFGGSGASRTVTVMPATNRNGTATITVSVSDGQLTTSTNFVVTVTAINDPPTISSIANQAISQDTSTAAIGFTVGDVETPSQNLTLNNASSNPTLVPVNNIVFGGSGANRTVTVTPAAGQSGTATITVSVRDAQLTTSTSFVLAVGAVSTVPVVYLTSPLDGAGYLVATNIVLSAEALSVGSSVTNVEFYEGETKLGEAAASPYVMTVSNVLVGTHTYTARAFAGSGATNVSSPITVSVGFITSADFASPTLAVANVLDNTQTTNATLMIKGTGKDNLKLAQVIYSINNEPFQAATGTTNWTVQANLVPGTNKVRFVGIDYTGNHSVTNLRRLFYVVTNGITLMTNGAGTINGVINRHVLEVGRGYQLVAVARPGNLFSNWTAGAVVMGTNAVLNFQMISNLVLRANFVTNNFMSRKGIYTGLAYDTNNVTFSNAGFFRLTLSGRGAFSGVTLLAGGVHPFTGRFWVDGRATVRIARNGKAALTNQLTIDLVGNSGISGTMSDGAFTVPLQADKAVFAQTNPAPYAGRYTMIVPGTGGVAGDGVGAVNMGPLGTAVLGGALADGTVITRTAPVSGAGWWPLYVPLYTGKGMVISWVQFDTNGTKSLHGDAVWTKNPVPGKYYTNGFTLLTSVDGGQYVAPAVGPTNRVLELTSGTVTLTGGNLAAAITDSVVLTNNNLFVITGTNGLKLTINPANGMVNGSFTHPETKKLTAIKAVVQQAQTNIQGFFLGTNLSGRILLFP